MSYQLWRIYRPPIIIERPFGPLSAMAPLSFIGLWPSNGFGGRPFGLISTMEDTFGPLK